MQKRQILSRMFGVATLAMMFGAGAAYAQSDATQSGTSAASTQTESSGTSGASSSQTKSGAQVSKADQQMMREMAQTNLAEIEAGKLAKEKSQDKQVQEFAEKMIDDHTQAQEQLQELAQQKGVTLPTQPDKKQQAAMKKMESMSGDRFDKQYLSQGGLRDHREAQNMLSRVEKRAQDDDLKELARSMQPTINEHYDMARDMQREKAATSTGTSGGTSDKPESSGSSGESGTEGSSNMTGPSKQ